MFFILFMCYVFLFYLCVMFFMLFLCCFLFYSCFMFFMLFLCYVFYFIHVLFFILFMCYIFFLFMCYTFYFTHVLCFLFYSRRLMMKNCKMSHYKSGELVNICHDNYVYFLNAFEMVLWWFKCISYMLLGFWITIPTVHMMLLEKCTLTLIHYFPEVVHL